MSDPAPTSGDKPENGTSSKRVPAWIWAAGAAIFVIVAWQVGQGVFIKSIDAPGAGSITFYPPNPPAETHAADIVHQPQVPAALNSANMIQQSGGNDNQARIHGDHNHIEQHGTGNTATIGGLDDAPPPLSHTHGPTIPEPDEDDR